METAYTFNRLGATAVEKEVDPAVALVSGGGKTTPASTEPMKTGASKWTTKMEYGLYGS